MEVTFEQLRAAERFWAEQRERVLQIAEQNGLEIYISEGDDSFLYYLYDNGDYMPSDSEVLESIKEYLED